MDTNDNNLLLRQFACGICDKRFATAFSRDRHEAAMHPDEDELSDNDSDEMEVNSSQDECSDDNSDEESNGESETNESDEESNGESETNESDESLSLADEGFSFQDFVDEAVETHEQEYNQLMSEIEEQYDGEETEMDSAIEKGVSEIKQRMSKTLRKLICDYILDLKEKEKDPLFQVITSKAKKYKDKGFEKDEAIRASVNYWKYAIGKLIPPLNSLQEEQEDE